MSIAKLPCFKVGFALVFFLGGLSIVFASNSRILKKIEVFSIEDSNQILLEFDEAFLGLPKINFGSASIDVYLDYVQKDPNVPSHVDIIENSLIKGIRPIRIPGKNFLHLEIQLVPNFSIDYPEIAHNGKNLVLTLRNSVHQKPLLSNNEFLINEIEQRVKKEDYFFPTFANLNQLDFKSKKNKDESPIKIDDWGETFLTMVASLIFVLLLIYLMAFLYKRFFSNRFASIKGKVGIRQISSYYVGPKQKVVVFDFNGRQFACGVTPSSINLIAELFDDNVNEKLNKQEKDGKNIINKDDKSNSNFSKILNPEIEKIKKKDFSKKDDQLEFKPSIKYDESLKDVFLENDFEKETKSSESKNIINSKIYNKNKMEDLSSKAEILKGKNQIITDFAAKLTKRIKLLRPIK